MKRVRVVEYYAGNIFNVVRAFEHLGCEVALASRPEDVAQGDFVVLPGVGAFGDGMATLRERGLVEPMQDWIRAGRPFLGICLGMQLLLGRSEEFGLHEGLGVIPGTVKRLPRAPGLKVPNIGWLPLQPAEAPGGWAASALRDFPPGRDVYFVHSYAAAPDDPRHCLARTPFGEHAFCSAVHHGNVQGFQFHPEKSSSLGLGILANFLNFSA